ncbi:FG-GAP-like repeat-containing protein [Limibacter armeniacum]|uniref:FG-GAP-like repeat-containing protein n=1 Tax=Limibacter armeniacum TaxID=466084 RepID=UPI002FE52C2B
MNRIGYIFLTACVVSFNMLGAMAQGFEKVSSTDLPALYEGEVLSLDLDLDGMKDLVISGKDAGGSWYLQAMHYNGSGWDSWSNGLTELSDPSLLAADVNSDGISDLIVTGKDTGTGEGKVHVYTHNGSGTWTSLENGLPDYSNAAVLWGDFRSEGKQGILLTGSDTDGVAQTRFFVLDENIWIEKSTNLPSFTNAQLLSFDADLDGRTDLFVSGQDIYGNYLSKLYVQTGVGTWEAVSASFQRLTEPKLDKADFDQDGRMDLIMSGFGSGGTSVAKVYLNKSAGWQENTWSLPQLAGGDVKAGDFDLDGYIDVFLSGVTSGGVKEIWALTNSSGTGFTDSGIAFTLISDGGIAVADWNGDNKLDLLTTGNTYTGVQTILYQNNDTGTVSVPTAPAGLSTTVEINQVLLEWNAVSGATAYEVRLGSEPGKGDYITTLTQSSGERAVLQQTSSGLKVLIDSLEEGTYYWSVHAIGSSHQGGAFASEASFTVCDKPNLGDDFYTCAKAPFTLSAGKSGETVTWRTLSGKDLGAGLTLEVSLIAEEEIEVTVDKPALGCQMKDTVKVSVWELPEANLPEQEFICKGGTYLTNLTGTFAQVSWYSLSQDKFLGTTQNVSVNVSTEEILEVTVTDFNGCSSLDTLTITSYPVPQPGLAEVKNVCWNAFDTLRLADSWTDVSWKGLISGNTVNGVIYPYVAGEKDSVEVTVIDINGCVGKDTILLESYELPTPDLGSDLEVCADNTISFDAGEGWSETVWRKLSDGAVISTNQKLDWEVNMTDSLELGLKNSNGCWAYDTVKVSLLELPVLATDLNLSECSGSVIDLDAGAGHTTYQWKSLRKDEIVGNEQVLPWLTTETDTLELTVWNDKGCFTIDSVIVEMWELPTPDLGGDRTVCKGGELNFEAGSVWQRVRWGTILSGVQQDDTSSTWSHAFVQNDSVWVEVTDSNGCINTDTIAVEVYDLPDPGLEATVIICEESEVNLNVELGIWETVTWRRFSDGLTSNDESFSYQVLEKDTVEVTVSDANGCSGADTIVVDFYPIPRFDLGADTAICFDETLLLDVGGGWAEVKWYSQKQGYLSSSRSLQWLATASDTVWAEVTNIEGCLNTDSIAVKVNPLPEPDLGADIYECIGETIALNAGTWERVEWHSKLKGALGTDAALSYEISEPDTLWVSVENANGCIGNDTIPIHPYALPDYTLGADDTICYMTSKTLSVSEDWTNVTWYSNREGELADGVYVYEHTATVKDTLWSRVENANGCIAYDTIVIDVFDLPAFTLGSDQSVCQGEQVTLKVEGGWPTVNWFEQGVSTPIAEDTWYINVDADDTKSYVAEVFNPEGCVNYDTITINRLALPVFSLGANQQICEGEALNLEVEVENIADVSWYSDFRGLLQKGTASSYTQTVYNDETIWATVTNSNGCIYSDTVEVTKLALPTFSLGQDTSICYMETIALSVGNADDQVKWFSSQLGMIEEGNDLTFEITQTDTLWAERTNSNGCIWTDTLVVNVLPLPDFVLPETLEVCDGEQASLTVEGDWQSVEWFDNSGNLLHTGVSFDTTVEQSMVVTANVTSWDGCNDAKSVSIIKLDLPVADAGIDRSICTEGVTTIGSSAIDGIQYQWFPTIGLSSGTVAQPEASPAVTTTYFLTATNDKGCISLTDSVTVFVDEFYSIDAGPDKAICYGEGTVLETTIDGGASDYKFEWSPQAGLDDPASSSPMAFPEETTTYIVKASLGDCLTRTDTITVVVNDLPVVTVSEDIAIGAGTEVTLEASGGTFYLWSPDYNMDRPNIATPTVSPEVTTTYTVRVMSAFGCVSTGSVTVFVGNEIFVPNLFTPNGDGTNDIFKIYGKGVARLTLQIVDQQGNIVFTSDNISQIMETGWDGNFGGKALPNGTYYWKMIGVYKDGSNIKFKGTDTGIINLQR